MRMVRPCIWTVTAVLLLAISTPAPGQEAATYDPRVAFAETDTNQDGVIDHAEFQNRLDEVFFSADTDKNGFLDPTELKRLAFPEDFREDDKDADGRVSMHEFLRVRFHDFTKADQNDDGVLELDEVIAAFEGRRR